MQTESTNKDGRRLDEDDAKLRGDVMTLRYTDHKDKERSIWVKLDDNGEVWIEPHLFVHELAMLCSGERMITVGKRMHPLMRASWLRTQCSGAKLANLEKLVAWTRELYDEARAAKEAK